MHTARYLDFHSHNPIHVKRGCLYDRANSVNASQSNLQTEQLHLSRVLSQNGYPPSFIRSAAHPPTACDPVDDEDDSLPIVSIPYVAGMSEKIRCIDLQGFQSPSSLLVWTHTPLLSHKGEGHAHCLRTC